MNVMLVDLKGMNLLKPVFVSNLFVKLLTSKDLKISREKFFMLFVLKRLISISHLFCPLK